MQLENDEQYSNDWKLTTASLDSITALPDHGADGARVHVLNQTREEGLASEVSVCEMLESIGMSGRWFW
jgi:hypothetical protein